MATVTTYLNGATMGKGNPNPVGGPRGQIQGWSAAAHRRHKQWLYSVDTSLLDGEGWAVTLTMRDCPAGPEDLASLINTLSVWLRDRGFSRWHWVIEWQRRGVPHLHMAVYHPGGLGHADARIVQAWLRISSGYGSSQAGQDTKRIAGAVGWLEYLSKHSARSLAHYQRQGIPDGWERTGRLWGKGGSWPVEAPLTLVLTDGQFWAVRRMARRYARSQALRRGDVRGAGYCRRMLRNPDRKMSATRGIASWIPQESVVRMAECAGWEGLMVCRCEWCESPAGMSNMDTT